jgi:hypothetical protein
MGAVPPSQLSSVPVQASCPVTASSQPPGRSQRAMSRNRSDWRSSGLWMSLMSTPVTWWPAAASRRATGTPQPHPMSRTCPRPVMPPAGRPARGLTCVRGVIAAVGEGDRVVAGADQFDWIGVHEWQVIGRVERHQSEFWPVHGNGRRCLGNSRLVTAILAGRQEAGRLHQSEIASRSTWPVVSTWSVSGIGRGAASAHRCDHSSSSGGAPWIACPAGWRAARVSRTGAGARARSTASSGWPRRHSWWVRAARISAERGTASSP